MTTDTRGDTTTTGATETSPITFSDTTGSTTMVADDTATSTSSTSTAGTSTGSTGATDSTTGDTDTTTGGEAGQTVNQLVSSGERTSSTNYTLVYTFGQPSSLQSTHQSSNYTIHGGLIGANGSPP